MDNKDAYDKKSMSYIPTYAEMGLPQDLIHRMETEYEDPIKDAKNMKEYELYMLRWQTKHREGLRVKSQSSKEKKDQRFLAHWYVIKNSEERERLIDESRILCDDVMDEVIKSLRIPSLISHAESLRIAIRRAPIALDTASSDKLRRFPMYSLETNSLEGSPSAFYRLWSHVFRIRRGQRMNARKR